MDEEQSYTLTIKDIILPAVFTISGLMLINPSVTIAGCFGVVLVFIAAFMVAVKILGLMIEAEEGNGNGN